MNKTIIDTSVYVDFFRRGKFHLLSSNPKEFYVYLSAVVAQELYVGALDPFTQKRLDQLCQEFRTSGRLLTPLEEEWTQCGKLLFLIGKKYGYELVRKSRLVNDVLIALSCKRIEATLVTSNLKDFKVIQNFVKFQFTSPD